MTHEALCGRGATWLQSNRRCEPVLYGNASTPEIPDVIGWSSRGGDGYRGSHVLECKVSRSDFMRDRLKGRVLVHPESGWRYRGVTPSQRAKLLAEGYEERLALRMGDYRWIVCPAGLLSVQDIERQCPDHGLLWCTGASLRVTIERQAPRRPRVNHAMEVELLRKALIHVSYNLAAHGCTVHLPTLTKFDGMRGLQLPTPAVKL